MVARVGVAAEPADDAKHHFERGQTLFKESDWHAAALEFEAAFALKPKSNLLLNVGQAWRLATEPRKAIDAYARFLAAAPNAPNATEVRQFISDLTIAQYGGAAAADKLAPRIMHLPPKAVDAHTPVVLETQITDPSGVFQPSILFRMKPGAYRSTPLVGDGDKYVGILPPLATGTLEYYLEALDTNSNGPAHHGTPSLPHVVAVREKAGAAAPVSPPPAVAPASTQVAEPIATPETSPPTAPPATPANWSLHLELAPSFVVPVAAHAPVGLGLEAGLLVRADRLRFGARAIAGSALGVLLRAAFEPVEFAWAGVEATWLGGEVASAGWGLAGGVGWPLGPVVVGAELAARHVPGASGNLVPLSFLGLVTASVQLAGGR